MKLLLVAATEMEVKLFLHECTCVDEKYENVRNYCYKEIEFDVLLTGLGTTFAAFHLTQTLHKTDYELIINAGIAGSLSNELKVGEVVKVAGEEFADLGIEEEHEFLTLFDSGYLKPDEFPFENRMLKADKLSYLAGLPKVKAITTNTSHSRKYSITQLKKKFTAQVQSMEGAAIFYVCRWFGIPCLQIRAVSNNVSPPEDAAWDIPLALDNLKTTLLTLFDELGQ